MNSAKVSDCKFQTFLFLTCFPNVQFMPNTGDEVLVTGAGDFQVCVHSVPRRDTIQTFKCHTMRVKRLATSPDAPHLIWSASEDGTIRFVTVVPWL